MDLTELSYDDLLSTAWTTTSKSKLAKIHEMALVRSETAARNIQEFQPASNKLAPFADIQNLTSLSIERHQAAELLRAVYNNPILPFSTFLADPFTSSIDDLIVKQLTEEEQTVYHRLKLSFKGSVKELLNLIQVSL